MVKVFVVINVCSQSICKSIRSQRICQFQFIISFSTTKFVDHVEGLFDTTFECK